MKKKRNKASDMDHALATVAYVKLKTPKTEVVIC